MSEGRADDALLRVADVVGQLIEFWGFKRNMGRLWCILFLEKKPLSAADLTDKLSLSAGAISMTLAELSKWGVVKKAWVPGDRRDYYEPETDIWKMVSRVFRERELEQIRSATDEMRRSSRVLADATREARVSPEDREAMVYARRQIENLLTLAQIGEKLVESVIKGEPVDAAVLESFSDGED